VASLSGITQRDVVVLRFCAEQFAAPMSVVAQLVARAASGGRPLAAAGAADAVARRTAARLEQLRYARRERLLGQTWLVPTGRGLALAAESEATKPFERWTPRALTLEHTAAVSRLRLHLADQHPEASWESERLIRRRLAEAERGQAVKLGYRLSDGGLWWPDGRATGIECELTTKKPHEYAQLVKDTDAAWTAGVWWFTRPGRAGWLGDQLEQAGGIDHEVLALPEGIGS
jgi:hypothetical protein